MGWFGGGRRVRQLETENATLRIKHSTLETQYARLLREWNRVTTIINDKGGAEFLHRGEIPIGAAPPSRGGKRTLTEMDIKRLLSLVHPDKHGGKQSAVEMTQRLLEMR